MKEPTTINANEMDKAGIVSNIMPSSGEIKVKPGRKDYDDELMATIRRMIRRQEQFEKKPSGYFGIRTSV